MIRITSRYALKQRGQEKMHLCQQLNINIKQVTENTNICDMRVLNNRAAMY